MAATKITVNNNASIKIEGDFEIVDPQGQAFGLAGRTASACAVVATPRTSRSATVRTKLAALQTPWLRANFPPRSQKSKEKPVEPGVRLSQVETVPSP